MRDVTENMHLAGYGPSSVDGSPATRGHPYREIPGGRAGDSPQAAAISLVSTEPRHDVACPVSWPQPHQDPLFPTQFVISGSLSVAAEKSHTSCLVCLNGGPGATTDSPLFCPSWPFTDPTNVSWGPAK